MRKAFLMSVDPASHDEYERRHRPIWYDLRVVLRNHGVRNYSIFLDAETSQLFGYAEVESEELWGSIARTVECQRWWEFMSDIMPSNNDDSPISRNLREVFHLD